MKTGYLLTGIALVTLAGGMISCSTSPTGRAANTPVDLRISFRPSALTTLIDNAELRIAYPLGDTLFEYPTVAHGMILDTLTLSPGRGVELSLTARWGERALYRGYDTIDVIAGDRVVSEIDMRPVASILRPAPLYQEVSLTGGETGAVGIDVYNVTNLFGASFRVLFDTTVLAVSRVDVGTFLGQDVLFVANPQPGYVAVSVTRKQSADQQVGGVSGSGRLATIIFRGVARGTDTLRFDAQIVALTDPTGQPIPEMPQMILETGEIVVLP